MRTIHVMVSCDAPRELEPAQVAGLVEEWVENGQKMFNKEIESELSSGKLLPNAVEERKQFLQVAIGCVGAD